MKRIFSPLIALFTLLLSPGLALAASGSGNGPLNLNMTTSNLGIFALVIFCIAYILVMTEEISHLRKSKPVVFAAGAIWAIVAIMAHDKGLPNAAHAAIQHNFLEYAELFLFLLVAMTYVNAMEERNVFECLRSWLVRKGYSYRKLFWITGVLAFFMSPIADNLTTALIMCAVVMAVGADNPKFVGIACINIVVSANAGGAFSPFGDITTLMVWQKGILPFQDFFQIFVPSVVNWLIPAVILHFAVPKVQPAQLDEHIYMKEGAKRIIALFILTIIIAISFHNVLHLPPALGMMTGLSFLQFFSYHLKMNAKRKSGGVSEEQPFDFFHKVSKAEWDTLLFFYGVVVCVGGLAAIGYLHVVSQTMYHDWGASLSAAHSATPANIAVGVLSAIVDNIPVMFAVLTMHPTMSEGQWLLVTLTAGTGGSMLSVGSAAGVALMGQAKGKYTFMSHLKWTWAIGLGYAASIYVHILMNGHLFT